MKLLQIAIIGTMICSPAFARSTASGDAMKACAAQWSAKKAAASTGTQTYREFSKACLAANKVQTPSAALPTSPTVAAPVPAAPIAPAAPRHKRASATAAGGSTASAAGAPAGASAKCRDGSFSMSKHHSGTCSHHGGVANWLQS